MRLSAIYPLIAIIFALLYGCSNDNHDSRLDYIYNLAEEDPAYALRLLDSLIASSAIDTLDKYYDLTRIRVNDRNYIKHTSDEKIKEVVNHFSKHPDKLSYTRSLYYAARVYSDMGDYPLSLEYFHKALETVPEEPSTNLLRSAIYSQTGRLLHTMRMYQDADSCLREAIRLNALLGDSLNLMYNCQLMSIININNNNLSEARKWLDKTREYSALISPDDTLFYNLFIAKIYYLEGANDSALIQIRHVPEQISADFMDNALANAAEIYLENNLLDSAQMYAVKLLHSPNRINKKIAYNVLLSSPLKQRLSIDTLLEYVNDYRRWVDYTLNGHQSEREVSQQAHYNYSVHKKRADKATERSDRTERYLYEALGALLILTLLYIISSTRKNRERKRLQTRLRNLERLQALALRNDTKRDSDTKSIESAGNAIAGSDQATSDAGQQKPVTPGRPTESGKMHRDELLEKIRKELDNLKETAGKYVIPEAIMKSEVRKRLLEHIEANSCLPDDDPLWNEIEKLVLEVSPYFQYHLQLLIGSPLKEHHYHLALLIKCGINPTGLTVLISRSKGTISNTRAYLAKTILGDKQSAQAMDLIIRML